MSRGSFVLEVKLWGFLLNPKKTKILTSRRSFCQNRNQVDPAFGIPLASSQCRRDDFFCVQHKKYVQLRISAIWRIFFARREYLPLWQVWASLCFQLFLFCGWVCSRVCALLHLGFRCWLGKISGKTNVSDKSMGCCEMMQEYAAHRIWCGFSFAFPHDVFSFIGQI